MKTATVTWTTYNNYGTVLQAYALQQELLKLGHENAILCDEKIIAEQIARGKANGKKAAPAPRERKAEEPALRRAAHVLLSPRKAERVLTARLDREKYERPYYASQEAVEQFKRDSLILDREVSPDSLDELNERYDAFLAGSDQVWSVFEHTFNPFFYLDFATKRKIAYAPCLGTDKIPETMREKLRGLLSSFDALSARERVSAEQLAELTGRKVEWTVDPTLLRGRDDWEEDIRQIQLGEKPGYLLCYFLNDQPWYFEQAKRIAKQCRLRLLLIPSRWNYVNSEYVRRKSTGPLEFVALIRRADFVLTDSYHGSIFSLLFERDFQYLQRFREDDPDSQNIRIHSLFDALGVNDLIVTPDGEADPSPEIGWEHIRETLDRMRNESMTYLAESLSQRRGFL